MGADASLASHACDGSGRGEGSGYARRRPEESVLYDEVRAQLETFLARVHPIVIDRAEAAVDVDKLSDLALVREIVGRSEGRAKDQSAESPSATNPPLSAS